MKKTSSAIVTIITFIIAIIYFFPIFWMILCGFKHEIDVVSPTLSFVPTLENFKTIFSGEISHYFMNSVYITLVSTSLSMMLGVPVSYALVMSKFKRGDDLFFWFISTTLLPPVGIVIPVYIIFNHLSMLDTYWGLTLVYTAMNIPLVIWMMCSFFKDIPHELIEASKIDGATELTTFFKIILPLSRHGLSATILLLIVFIWNEFFFALHLTYTRAATLPVHMAIYMTQEGLFWAKMCAISTIAILPPLLAGWINQKQLVRGLTMGAIKG